jgi:hypothetical protein
LIRSRTATAGRGSVASFAILAFLLVIQLDHFDEVLPDDRGLLRVPLGGGQRELLLELHRELAHPGHPGRGDADPHLPAVGVVAGAFHVAVTLEVVDDPGHRGRRDPQSTRQIAAGRAARRVGVEAGAVETEHEQHAGARRRHPCCVLVARCQRWLLT